ncbi:hypothetical protein C4J93_2237 [Pseudomonas sp. R2-37-08W]|uniref:hypothetical protein n=1 Tax=unclassified Pseudomonas TaxID=196821 RepID=UPI000F578C58|nr:MULTISPECIES: hypothetical protein [unclassified Pseudomonas]AZF10435.1 hypothetical protein C4J93_2237 [Pseudomonas sp. R2-37-08W]AZF47346.1 hypothetical protein C4J86_2111 [Pseudomonas sp. R2-7-07]
MQHHDAYTQLMACRQLAMDQNQKLFNEANAISRNAFDLLERPDFDSQMFDEYLRLRGKAEALFREAIEHLSVLNTHFPSPASSAANEDATVARREKEVA